jgi:hypothetical protein
MRASTGPQTAHGRARAARNAFRHALSLPVCSNPALSEEVVTLARKIAGPGANTEAQDLALQVAEAQIDLRRVRYARQRHQLLSRALADPYYEARARSNIGTIFSRLPNVCTVLTELAYACLSFGIARTLSNYYHFFRLGTIGPLELFAVSG